MHVACAGRLWSSFGGIYSESGLLFSLFFFSKKESGKQEVGVPSLPGGGWGGDGRVHASGANLDLYLPVFTIFVFMIFIISAVLLFSIIIQMAQLAAFPPSLST